MPLPFIAAAVGALGLTGAAATAATVAGTAATATAVGAAIVLVLKELRKLIKEWNKSSDSEKKELAGPLLKTLENIRSEGSSSDFISALDELSKSDKKELIKKAEELGLVSRYSTLISEIKASL